MEFSTNPIWGICSYAVLDPEARGRCLRRRWWSWCLPPGGIADADVHGPGLEEGHAGDVDAQELRGRDFCLGTWRTVRFTSVLGFIDGLPLIQDDYPVGDTLDLSGDALPGQALSHRLNSQDFGDGFSRRI